MTRRRVSPPLRQAGTLSGGYQEIDRRVVGDVVARA